MKNKTKPLSIDRAVKLIKVAGFHDDGPAYMKVFNNSKIPLYIARSCFQKGADQRLAGWPKCACAICLKAASKAGMAKAKQA